MTILRRVCFRIGCPFWILFCFLIAVAPNLCAADNTRVIGFQSRSFAITGATVVPRPDEKWENATVVIRNGLIVAAGPDVTAPKDAEIVDGAGLWIYAGFIDAAASDLIDKERVPKTDTGREVDFTRYVLAATRPDNRKSLTPQFRAIEGLKREAEKLDAARKSGFTVIHVVPDGRIAGGQGTLITTADAPLRESVIQGETFQSFQIFAPRGNGYPSTLMGAIAHLRQAFLDAEHYHLHHGIFENGGASVTRPPNDAALETLHDVLDGRRIPLFLANSRDSIHRSLNFCEEFNLAPTLWGGRDAYRTIERLKATGVSVIMQIDFDSAPKIEPPKDDGSLQAEVKAPLRAQQDELNRWKERVTGLNVLNENAIPFALSSRGLNNRSEVLASLRKAIEEGLPSEAALAALTIDAAELLDLEKRLGTIEQGKLAHLVVLTGPFDHEKSKVRFVFIDGVEHEYNKEAKPVDLSEEEPSAEPNLTGVWKTRIESAIAPTTATLDLRQTGKKLSGTFRSEQGDGKLTEGSVKDGTAEFTVAIGAGAQSVLLQFHAEIDEDKLSGTLKPAFGAETKWTGKRVKKSDSSADEDNPVALSKPVEETDDSEADSADSLPTELESDRLNRPVQTGGDVLITGGTVLTGTGQTLPNTSILIRDGKIAAIGPDLQPEENMTVIDARGRFVIPGIIDTHSHIMITDGINESTQSIVPEVSVRDVVNTNDVSEYRALAGGVTSARLFHGSANVIGGQDAVVKLKHGLTADKHLIPDAPQGVKFALGENVKYRTTRFPNTRLGVEATLKRAFLEAVDYRRRWLEYERERKEVGDDEMLLPPRRDLRLEALADIVGHEKFIHSHCYRADEILMLLRVASDLGIRVWSLQHVLEGYKVAPEIAEHGASCSMFSDWWAYKVEAFDAIPYNAALLNEAGANVVIKSDDAELIRHLYYEAAKTVRYGGMSPEEALQTITLNPARELGLDDRIGSIEVGKDGDVAIFNGHPLNSYARCEMTLIEGEVYFDRAHAPTAMTETGRERSANPPKLQIPDESLRQKQIDLAISPNGKYALVGATLHTVDGPVLPSGVLIIENGKITEMGVGPKATVPSDAKVIDVTGLHISPGFIDPGTTLGLTEIRRVRETNDYAEGGQFQPDLRAGVAINRDSELIPVARAGGVTLALIRPTGGVIAGQTSLAQLSGWTTEEMILDYEVGLQINWPSDSRREKRIDELREFLKEARHYDALRIQAEQSNQPGPIDDPRYEAMRPYLSGKKPIFIEANSRRSIVEALLFAEEEKLSIVITGATEAWKVAGELKKRKVPVVIGQVMTRPRESYDPFDAPYANAGRLHEAGVQFSIRSSQPSQSRNLPFEAAMAVAHGLPEEQGLRAITLSTAEILGVADQVGSLTIGKRADLMITDGLPLQHTTQIKGVFIAGTPHRPESKHTRLYETYRRRLKERQQVEQ